MKKKFLTGIFACILLLTLGLLTACDGGKTPADTIGEDTPAPTEAPTEEPTAPDTEAPTDEETEAPTEEPTAEPETDDGIPLNSLTIGGADIKEYTLVVQEAARPASVIPPTS